MIARPLVCLILAAAFLSACTGLRQAPVGIDWDKRRNALLAVNEWSLQGRVAIRAADGGGQASLRWQQAGVRSRLQLAGPFGAGQVELIVTPDRVTLTDGKGEHSVAYSGVDAAERFMAEQLGWSFPVRSARYWVLGLLDPAGDGKLQFDEGGALQSLTQHGWTVDFDRFAEFGEQYLPAKLVIESPKLRLRLVVRGWQRDTV